jgi:hypothetical protein
MPSSSEGRCPGGRAALDDLPALLDQLRLKPALASRGVSIRSGPGRLGASWVCRRSRVARWLAALWAASTAHTGLPALGTFRERADPRDRQGTFDPRLVGERAARLAGLDQDPPPLRGGMTARYRRAPARPLACAGASPSGARSVVCVPVGRGVRSALVSIAATHLAACVRLAPGPVRPTLRPALRTCLRGEVVTQLARCSAEQRKSEMG